MPYEEIEKLQEQMTAERNAIKKNAKRIAWYMRGGVNFTDIMNMSHEEIEQLNDIISDNLETTKKSRLPFF